MIRKEKLTTALLSPINPSGIVILGMATVLWGLWMISPFWSVYATSASYAYMAVLLPEWGWGLIALFCGSVSIYGAVKRRYNPLIVGSSVQMLHWLVISILFFMGAWTGTGWIFALTLSTYAAFVRINLRVNKYKKDKTTLHIKSKFDLKI